MTYRFAIIGCGNVAARHAERVKSVGVLTAVCDPDLTKGRKFAEHFDVPVYENDSKLFAEQKPDVAIICTPNGLHRMNVANALAAGCHVLCEKPLSITSHDARYLIDLATGYGRKLLVVKQNRYNPPVQAVKSLLDNGKLGRVHSFQVNCFWNRPSSYYNNSWRGKLDIDGGTLFTQFSHFADLLYWYLGEIDRAAGWRANYMHRDCIEFEDAGVVSLVMRSGAIGSIQYTINASRQNMEGSITLFGEKGTVSIGGTYLETITHFEVENETKPVFGEKKSNPLDSLYQQLINSLESRENEAVEAAEAIKSIEMIEKIYACSPLLIP